MSPSDQAVDEAVRRDGEAHDVERRDGDHERLAAERDAVWALGVWQLALACLGRAVAAQRGHDHDDVAEETREVDDDAEAAQEAARYDGWDDAEQVYNGDEPLLVADALGEQLPRIERHGQRLYRDAAHHVHRRQDPQQVGQDRDEDRLWLVLKVFSRPCAIIYNDKIGTILSEV